MLNKLTIFILLIGLFCCNYVIAARPMVVIGSSEGSITSDEIKEPIIQANDPTVDSAIGVYFPTTSGKMCVKEDTFLWCSAAGTYTPISTTYSLDLTLTGVAGADKVTIGGTDYTSSQVITGLSGVVPITASFGDSDTLDVTGATGSYPDYSITMDADKSADFAFSTASVGTPITNNPATATTTTAINISDSKGTSFLTTGSATNARLRLDIATFTAGATITARIGTTSNLNTYLAEGSATVTATGELVIDMGACALDSATTYWFALVSDDDVSISKDADTYTDGEMYFAFGTAGWFMEGTAPTFDIVFKVEAY